MEKKIADAGDTIDASDVAFYTASYFFEFASPQIFLLLLILAYACNWSSDFGGFCIIGGSGLYLCFMHLYYAGITVKIKNLNILQRNSCDYSLNVL